MKYDGLSQLADVARDLTSPRGSHYPARRKGEQRRINPNREGALWLEDQSATDTELDDTERFGMGDIDPVTGETEFLIDRALGWWTAKRKGMYPQPMFTLARPGAFKALMCSYPDPCPDCDDWSRTSRCAVHHDRDGVAGLGKGADRRAVTYSDVRPRPTVSDILAREAMRMMVEDSPHTLEINGETVQGTVRSVRMEVEGNGSQTVTFRY